MEKTIVFGIDSVGIDRLRRLVNSGKLPNIGRVAARGDMSLLKSTIPCVSAPAWTTFSTGLEPENHEIYGFFKTNKDIYTGEDVNVERFWDKFNDKIVVNIPITYPPSSKVMVSGIVSPTSIKPTKEECMKISNPSEAGEILSKHDYIVNSGEAVSLKSYVKVVRRRRNVFIDLLNRYDWRLGVVMFGSFDRMTHNPNIGVRSNKLDTLLMEIDACIGEILSKVGDVNVFMLSDHGEQIVNHEVYISQLLVDNDLAEFSEDENGRVTLDKKSNALFYAEEHSEFGKIKLNNGSVKDKVVDVLQQHSQIDEVYNSNQIYGSDAKGDVPDLVFKVIDGVPKMGRSEKILKHKETIQHSMDGIFVMGGPDIRLKSPISDAQIEDVAPTILQLYGKDNNKMDGNSHIK